MSSHFKSFMLNKFIIQYINQIENLWKNYANILKKENLKGTIVFAKFITFTIKTVFARI